VLPRKEKPTPRASPVHSLLTARLDMCVHLFHALLSCSPSSSHPIYRKPRAVRNCALGRAGSSDRHELHNTYSTQVTQINTPYSVYLGWWAGCTQTPAGNLLPRSTSVSCLSPLFPQTLGTGQLGKPVHPGLGTLSPSSVYSFTPGHCSPRAET
jgi:hypothetical protein